MTVNIELLKCSLVMGILFFVLSHPLLYRFLNKQLHTVMAFVDERMCPTEGGVLVHAVIFVLIVYFGKKLYDKNVKPEEKKAPKAPLTNEQLMQKQNAIPQKCQVYCEKISNNIQNKINQNNAQQAPSPTQQQQQQPNNNAMMAQQPNNNAMIQQQQPNNNAMIQQQQQQQQQNNNMMAQQQQTNNMMGNNAGNVLNNNINMTGNNSNGGFNDMMVNTLGGNNANNNNNAGLSCNSMSDFSNQISSGNMFSENTTYVDDMYSSVNF